MNETVFLVKESIVRNDKIAPIGGGGHLLHLLKVFFLCYEAFKILAGCEMYKNFLL